VEDFQFELIRPPVTVGGSTAGDGFVIEGALGFG